MTDMNQYVPLGTLICSTLRYEKFCLASDNNNDGRSSE